jgi:YD repeat-containing protein
MYVREHWLTAEEIATYRANPDDLATLALTLCKQLDRAHSRLFAQRRARRWSRTGAAHGGPRTRKRSPGYDADGNLTEKVEPGGRAWRYEWSAVGLLARDEPLRQEIFESIVAHFTASGGHIIID